MYNEEEYIYQEFMTHFGTNKKEPIVLYGIGNNTGKLLEKITDYNVVGLMDGKITEGSAWNKKIISYEDVLQLEIKKIIVIARPAVIGVIYHRISNFCFVNAIKVYDVKGNDLSLIYRSRENDIPYFRLKKEHLMTEIEKHDIITFDIFDTLVMRKILYPIDIFEIVEKRVAEISIDFAYLRKQAEENLYKRNITCTIYDIYDEFQRISGANEEQKKKFFEEEIAVEMEYIVPRKYMQEIYNDIVKNKKIYLISDMYFTKEILVKILNKCGYEGYEDIYVSCEKKKSKREGLFELFLEETKSDCKCLHIGDDYSADIKSAVDAGMDVFQIMSAREMLESSTYGKLIEKTPDLFSRLTIGLFCREAFDDPFVLYETKGRLEIKDIHKFTSMFIAPMICYFSIWLMQQMLLKKCDYVLYPSRDAYLIEKICDIVKKNQRINDFPQGEYFYASRRALLAATVFNKEDIARVAQLDFDGSIKELFQKRFQVEIEESAENIKASNLLEVDQYIQQYEAEIIHRCTQERNNYLEYITKTKINKYKKMAFIDFVAAGKVQNGLVKILPEQDIQGFYFLKREGNGEEIDRDINVESFYPSKGAFQIDSNVYKYYLFLEMVLTSPEPTFHSADENGNVLFMEEVRSKEHLDVICEMQRYVADYCDEISKLYPNLLSAEINREIPDIMLGFVGKEYSKINVEKISSLILTDEFLSQTFNIFE